MTMSLQGLAANEDATVRCSALNIIQQPQSFAPSCCHGDALTPVMLLSLILATVCMTEVDFCHRCLVAVVQDVLEKL